MKNKTRFFTVLEILGILIFIVACIGLFFNLLTTLQVAIIAEAGLLLTIPSNIIFAKKVFSEDKGTAAYWKSKLIGIPICIIGFMVAIIYEIVKN